MPKAANLEKMLVIGGPDLTFSIKACRILTHEINPSFWEGDAKAYREAIDPVVRAGRLEAVLFQFPPNSPMKRITAVIWINYCLISEVSLRRWSSGHRNGTPAGLLKG
jgi:uncharacterized protein YecE (DUF72 family)